MIYNCLLNLCCSQVIFVSGNELIRRDACVADNGIVHVIDGLVQTHELTLAEVLESISQLSTFNYLIKAAGLSELLNRKWTLTIFAPTNEVLDTQEIDCLKHEKNKWVLKNVLLHHISKPAEYSDSLVQRDFVITRHCYEVRYYHYYYYYYYYNKCNKLQIKVDNDAILVGNEGAQVILRDIPASNGVIHIISKPLFVSRLDFEKLCPDSSTSKPTTSTPTETKSPTSPDGGDELA